MLGRSLDEANPETASEDQVKWDQLIRCYSDCSRMTPKPLALKKNKV